MKRILIIKLGSLGDVLRTTCILPGLCKKYPNARIAWFTSRTALVLLADNPFIDDFLIEEDFHTTKATDTHYDLVINLDDDDWACEIAASLPSGRLIGAYSTGQVITYTKDSAKWFDMGLISRFGKDKADQLKKENRQSYPSILFEILDIPACKPTLELPEQARDFAQKFFEQQLPNKHPVIGLNTGAGHRWRFKQLSEQKTAELVGLLTHSLGATVVLFGGPQEKVRNLSIQKLSNGRAFNSGHNNTLLEFSALIGLCDLLITSDSLALHVGTCLSVPMVSFFGPTSASEIELFTPGIKVVPEMDCICCYKRDCDFSLTCMDNISAQTLLKAAQDLLSVSLQPSTPETNPTSNC